MTVLSFKKTNIIIIQDKILPCFAEISAFRWNFHYFSILTSCKRFFCKKYKFFATQPNCKTFFLIKEHEIHPGKMGPHFLPTGIPVKWNKNSSNNHSFLCGFISVNWQKQNTVKVFGNVTIKDLGHRNKCSNTAL